MVDAIRFDQCPICVEFPFGGGICVWRALINTTVYYALNFSDPPDAFPDHLDFTEIFNIVLYLVDHGSTDYVK